LKGQTGKPRASIYRLDSDHGSLLRRYSEMGKPAYPTSKQLDELRRAAQLAPPETKSFSRGEMEITLPPQGLAIVEFKP
jgi:xylan 1,4-beta-xylosidase